MRRLAACLCAIFAAVVCAAAFVGHSYAQGNDALEQNPVIMYPSTAQLASHDFILDSYKARVAQGDDPVLVFGSSELDSCFVGEFHPAQFFRRDECANDLMVVGAINHESLWEAIELAAIAPHLEDKRIVLFPSMQWFYGDTPAMAHEAARHFSSEFSAGAWQAMQENEALSDGVKKGLAQRVSSYGVAAAQADGGNALNTAFATVESLASQMQADIRARLSAKKASDVGLGNSGSMLVSVPQKDRSKAGSLTDEDWDAFKEAAATEAQERADDDSFSGPDNYAGWIWRRARLQQYPQIADFSEGEFSDFELLLQVCEETGVQPLVILQPMKGWIYDETPIDAEVRAGFNDRIKEMCADHDFEVADFTDHDYDRYFLRDWTHPSPLGAVYYSEAIYKFLEK